MRYFLEHRLKAVALACAMAWVPGVAKAAPAAQFPALDRAAVQVRAPERTVLLAAAMAGMRVVAVGERGIVALSDNAGVSWRQAKAVPVGVTLTALQFLDSKQGWAVGHGGVILKSADGGDSWVRQADGRLLAQLALEAAQARAAQAPGNAAAAAQLKAAQLLVADGPDKPLFDLYFADSRHGFVVGSYNLFFETRDGGATWASAMGLLDNPKGAHLYAIGAQGDAIFIAGEQGALFRSLDAGAMFKPLASPYKGSWFSLVMLRDKSLVVAGLRGNALYSADQGETWSRVEGAPPVSFFGGVALADGQALLSNQAGQLLKSRDGAPFTALNVPSLPPLAALMPLPGGDLLAVGVTGAIRLTSPTAAHSAAAAAASAPAR